MMNPLAVSDLYIRGATKRFGDVSVLKGIDLSVDAGSFVVVVGPSGCGKTTLLRSLAGLESLDEGEIRLGGRDIAGLEPRARDVAMVFQNYALYPTKSVFENMAYGLRIRRLPTHEIAKRVNAAAARLRIEHLMARRPSQLSGGQRQRVAIGRAMVREPKLFLFDEPLSNLDAALRGELRVEIKRIQRSLGVTTVYVTHDQQEAMTLADVLVVMREGHVEQMGPPKTLYDRPKTRFVASFLGTPPMAFLPARVVNGALTFEVGGAFTIPVPPSLAAEGRAIDVGFRPEDIRLEASGTPGSLSASVDLVEELGAYRLIHLASAAGALIANIPAGDAPPRGEVGLTLRQTSLSLFDPVSGDRLAAFPA